MSVRVISKRLCKREPGDSKLFWETVEKHQRLIKRCFQHILLKYPPLDSAEDAYNTLLTELYRKNIFSRFDRRKLVASKKAVSPDEVTAAECTDEEMEKLGIDVTKRFEQFVYQWIHQILRDAYKQHGRYIRTMSLNNGQAVENRLQLKAARGTPTETAWPSSWNDKEDLEHYQEMMLKAKRIRVRPCYLDAGDYRSCSPADPMQETIANELIAHLEDHALGSHDKEILRLKLDGMKDKDVATALNVNVSKVHAFKRKAQTLLR